MKYKKFFTAMLTLVLLSGISTLIPSIFLQILEQKKLVITGERILFLLSIMFGSKALGICVTIFREHYAKEFNKQNFRTMLENSLHMDYDSIITMGPANILDRIAGAVNDIYAYMTGDYIQIWASVITVSLCLVLTASIQIPLALLLLLVLPINYFGYRFLNHELEKRSKEMSEQTSKGFQEILSYTQQVDYFKQTADYTQLFQSLDSPIEKVYKSMMRVNTYGRSVSAALRALNEIVQNFVLMFIVYSFFSECTGPYTLMMTSILLPLYFSNVGTIVGMKLNQTRLKVATDFQKKLYSHKEPNGSKSISEITRIDYNVTELLIQDKSIPFKAKGSLKKGDIAQSCGASGCGKSTFAKALLKFRPVSDVKYNHIPIEELDNCQLRSRVEYISQNVPIVHGTLADNLFLNCERTKGLEKRFLEEPMLQSVFASKSFESEILENGANLSGGEKQKIALARALCSNADVLILDEVCSNIDQDAANSIYRCLEREREQRITIMISHDKFPDGFVNIKIHP